MLRRVFLSILLSLFTSVLSVSAQAIDDFSISASPDNPKEGSVVELSVQSFSTDLTRSKITWKENGVVVSKETGLTEKSFTAPKNGSVKNITIEVLTPSNIKLEKVYTISPQSLDLLWEAYDTYVPPFYKGKAMPAEQSLVRAVAIPNFTSKGALLDRTQTVYTWTADGVRSEKWSGFNKSSFIFKFNPLKNFAQVKVTASTVSGNTGTEENLTLKPFPTEIVFYEASPLLGTLYEKSFSKGIRLVTPEITLVAEPYYFSGAENVLSNVGFTWTVDGRLVNPGIDSSKITLRSPGKAGVADITLAAKHVEKTLQLVRTAISIAYEK